MMSRHWWVFLLRGIVSALFGLAALLMPGLTLLTLVLVFGIYAIVDGVAAVFSSFNSRNTDDRWWIGLLEGIVSIIAGIAALIIPGIATLTLLIVIAVWAVLTGIMQIVAAIRLRREIDNEFWLGLSGVLSLIFGIYVFLFPGAGALAVAWLIGVYAIMFGIFFIALAFRLRSRHEGTNQPTQAAA
jgi:uncharacterized membrane protein HdeD (DUF308 family)